MPKNTRLAASADCDGRGYGPVVRFALIAGSLAVLLVTAAPAATGPTLVGHLTVVSSEPQCSPKPCGPPVTIRFHRAGTVRTVRVFAGAHFRVFLRAGTYRVTTPQTEAAGDSSIEPARIEIKRAATTRIAFVLRQGTA
jgi:hypothetical protein